MTFAVVPHKLAFLSPRQVEVTLHNRKKYRATVVGTDRSHDLAVVQIKAPDLTPMVLGESKNLQVGQKVYAIGNPFGLAGTLTSGIVSSIRSVQEPDGMTIDEIVEQYPVSREEIKAVLDFAAHSLDTDNF